MLALIAASATPTGQITEHGTESGTELFSFSLSVSLSPTVHLSLTHLLSVSRCLWPPPRRRGLIMGVWNSHTSVGNILGSLIAGSYVSSNWGMSFIVPGITIATMGVVCFLFLIERTYCHVPLAGDGRGGRGGASSS